MKKQETIEEIAERIYLSYENNEFLYGDSEDLQLAYKAGIVDGAKWQKERMYSEEEMIDFAFNTYCYISKIMNVPFNQISENKFHAIDNLEQFKKRNGK